MTHDMKFALKKCSDEKRCFLCEIQNLTLTLFCPLIFSKGKKLIAWCSTLLSGRVWKELTGVELCQRCVRLWREYPFHAPWIIIGVIHTTKRRRFNLDNCRFIALLYLQIDCFHAPVCNTVHDTHRAWPPFETLPRAEIQSASTLSMEILWESLTARAIL